MSDGGHATHAHPGELLEIDGAMFQADSISYITNNRLYRIIEHSDDHVTHSLTSSAYRACHLLPEISRARGKINLVHS